MRSFRSPTMGYTVEPNLDWDAPDIRELLERALQEDIGKGDITTDALFPIAVPARGTFLAQQRLVVAGLLLVERLYARLDPALTFRPLAKEGEEIDAGAMAEVVGDARALLRGERTALNFLQRLCGIATLTRRFRTELQGTGAELRDTRKTTPGLRSLEKYAVRVGGGMNHRFGLYDAILIKENHAQVMGSLGEAIRRAREKYGAGEALEAEVRNAGELEEALSAGADTVLLDNMSVEQVRQSVARIRGRARVEVSGGMRLENVRAYAECGVDYVSVGALTHSAAAADISFDLVRLSEAKP